MNRVRIQCTSETQTAPGPHILTRIRIRTRIEDDAHYMRSNAKCTIETVGNSRIERIDSPNCKMEYDMNQEKKAFT